MVQMSGRRSRSSKSKPEPQDQEQSFRASQIEFPAPVIQDEDQDPLSCYVSASAAVAAVAVVPNSNSGSRTKSWSWHCNVCLEEFKTRKQLVQHMMEHAIEMPKECRFCVSRFKNGAALTKHIQSRHFKGANAEAETETEAEGPEIESYNEINPLDQEIKLEIKKPKRRHSKSVSPGFDNLEFVPPVKISRKWSKPRPRSKKRRASILDDVVEEITHCRICKLDFPGYEQWRRHAVYAHAIIKNPCPIVEMNYVDVQTIMQETKPSVINTLRKTGEGQVTNEKIRLVFCRDKGNYVLKKSMSTEEHEPKQETDSESKPPVLSRPHLSEHYDDNEESKPKSEEKPEPKLEDKVEVQSTRAKSPKNPVETNSEPKAATVVTAINEIRREDTSESVSPSINKENMPSESADIQIESTGVVTFKRWPQNNTGGTKSPTSGSYIRFGNSSPESEKALTMAVAANHNVGNSHVVIIQNDAMHIGADFDEADEVQNDQEVLGLGHLSSNPNSPNPKIFGAENTPSKENIIDNSAECILPHFPEETTVMISEEIRSHNHGRALDIPIPSSQIVDVALATSLNGATSILPTNTEDDDRGGATTPGNGNSGQSPTSAQVEEGGSRSDDTPRMSPAQTPCIPPYENITPPIGSTPSSSSAIEITPSRSSNNNENEEYENDNEGGQLHIHLEETEITEVVRTNSPSPVGANPLEIDEEEAESVLNADDDFQCRVCHKVFTSEDELDSHFRESHFRVGAGSSIMEVEPESPCPGPQVTPAVITITESPRSIFINSNNGRRSLDQEQHVQVSVLNGATYAAQRMPIIQQQQQQQQVRGPNLDSALARQLMHEGPPSRIPPGGHSQGPPFLQRPIPTHSQGIRSQGIPPHMQQIQTSQSQVRGMSNGPHNITMNVNAALHQMVSQAGGIRPPLSSAPANYSMSQALGSRPMNNNNMPQSRPQLTIGHGPNPNLQQQQHQQLLRQQQQNQFLAQAQLHQHYQGNQAGSTPLQNALNNTRPMPISGIRHNSMERDGPRIVEVSSMGRTVDVRQQQMQAMHQQQLQQQQQHQQQQQQMHLRHPGMQGRPQQQQQQQGEPQQLRITSIRGGVNLNYPPGGQGQKRMGSPLPPLVDHSKQARISDQHPSHSHRGPIIATAPDLTITPRINPQQAQAHVLAQQQQQMSPVSILERNVSQAVSNGDANIRIGHGITLSLCQEGPSVSPQLSPALSSQSGRSSCSNSPLNTSSVASALAVRGVTVTPASPPISNNNEPANANQRYPVSINISANPNPNQRTTPPATSVIQRVERSQVQSGVFYPPLGQGHQFAVPRNPAPRGPSVVNVSLTDRPDRPPTVDLTDDDVHSQSSMTSTPLSRQLQSHGQGQGRPMPINPAVAAAAALHQHQRQQQQQQQQQSQTRPRHSSPTLACHLCNVLFNSAQSLEEHKFSRHQIPMNPRPVNAQVRVPVPRQGPPQLQQMRPISPSQPRTQSQANGHSRYMYIPLIDMNQMDANRLRRLEEIGITSIVPLHGNDRTLERMGIPIANLRSNGFGASTTPWDSVLPLGPVQQVNQPGSGSGPATGHRTSHAANGTTSS